MKKYLIKVMIIVMAFTSCNRQKKDLSIVETETTASKIEKEEGLKLMEQNCYACHSIVSKSHDEIIAPPMVAVKMRYLKQYNSKADFVNAVVAYTSNPNEKNALMFGAVSKFKAMPNLNFNQGDLKKIASYIYDNDIKTPVWFDAHFQQMKKSGQKLY